MKKMVINYLDKIFVTSDAATIMKEVCSINFQIQTILNINKFK